MGVAEPDPAVSGAPRLDTLVLFDGGCGLCTGSVDWALRRLPAESGLRFVPAGNPEGASLAAVHGVRGETGRSVVLITPDGRVLLRSDAALSLLARIPFWRFAAPLLRAIPRRLRDDVYDQIARHRHRVRHPGGACALSPHSAPHFSSDATAP